MYNGLLFAVVIRCSWLFVACSLLVGVVCCLVVVGGVLLFLVACWLFVVCLLCVCCCLFWFVVRGLVLSCGLVCERLLIVWWCLLFTV